MPRYVLHSDWFVPLDFLEELVKPFLSEDIFNGSDWHEPHPGRSTLIAIEVISDPPSQCIASQLMLLAREE